MKLFYSIYLTASSGQGKKQFFAFVDVLADAFLLNSIKHFTHSLRLHIHIRTIYLIIGQGFHWHVFLSHIYILSGKMSFNCVCYTQKISP